MGVNLANALFSSLLEAANFRNDVNRSIEICQDFEHATRAVRSRKSRNFAVRRILSLHPNFIA